MVQSWPWGSQIAVKKKKKVSVDDRKKIRKEHMKKLKIENEWSDSIDASKVEGAVSRIEVGEVLCAMNHENQESKWAL